MSVIVSFKMQKNFVTMLSIFISCCNLGKIIRKQSCLYSIFLDMTNYSHIYYQGFCYFMFNAYSCYNENFNNIFQKHILSLVKSLISFFYSFHTESSDILGSIVGTMLWEWEHHSLYFRLNSRSFITFFFFFFHKPKMECSEN